MKYFLSLIACLIAIIITSCKPSQETIQRALEQTQTAIAELATPTVVPTPTFTTQQKYATEVQPLIVLLDQNDREMKDWSSLMGTRHAFDTLDSTNTYQEYLDYMFDSAIYYLEVYQVFYSQWINNNRVEVNKMTTLADSIISSSYDIEVGLGSFPVPDELKVPQQYIVDCVQARSEYFQLINNVLINAYIPTGNESSKIGTTFPCTHYQDSIDLIKEFVQDNK